ncbi:MAG: radical SAM protein [Desulfobulbus sp.]|nr:radical SAM protein [Desulfobulbus sp.]
MDYQGTIIRPPSEAFSIILQVTHGCSHHRCTFCGAYRDKPFRIKSQDAIDQDLEFAARWCRRQTTLFLADGDALVLPHSQMITLLTRIRLQLPWVRRVSSYATCQNILAKKDTQLTAYKELGLHRLYLGLESGHDPTLKAIGKGVAGDSMIVACQRARAAGMFVSVTCLLGIAGRLASLHHAKATAEVLNQMQPNQIAILTLMLLKNTPLYAQAITGKFLLPSPKEMLIELKHLIAHLDPFRTQFHANHASNYFSLSGRFPRDHEKILVALEKLIRDNAPLKPETLRML